MNNIYSLDLGIYSYREAAQLIQRSPQLLSLWFRGRKDRIPVFESDYEGDKFERAVSFHDLIDSLVAAQFRECGVSMPKIRKSREALSEFLDTKHPFCHESLYTDRKEIFCELNGVLSEAVTRQIFSKQVLRQHLQHITYDKKSMLASLWRIYDGIEIDPMRAFGKPVIASTSIPVWAIVDSYYANKKVIHYDKVSDYVADDFGITPKNVKDAVKFATEFGMRSAA